MKFRTIAVALMIIVLTGCENTLLDHEHPVPEHTHPDHSGLLYNTKQLRQFSDMMKTIVADVADGERRRYIDRVVTIRATVEDIIQPDEFSYRLPYIDLETNKRAVRFVIFVSDNLPEVSKIYRKGSTYTFTVLITGIDGPITYIISSRMLGDAYGFDRD